METVRILDFRIHEKGQWAYIIWPWKTPEAFLYEAREWGATYQIRMPSVKLNQRTWIEFAAIAGTHGEYAKDLFFGRLDWGYALYRRFIARSSHYLTQHGLDGIPRALWEQAFEYRPGVPMGKVLFQFRVETTKKGVFSLTYHDWMQHFASGRNEHISRMAISVTKKSK